MVGGKRGLAFAKVSIYWVSFLLLGLNAISPAMATITSAMPDRNPVEIQMIEQLPYLMTIPTLLTAGVLAKRISRKALMVVGVGCYLVGGITCFFTDSYYVVLGCRCLLGIGIGILNPCTDGLIADYFYDSDEYPKIVGLNYTFKSLGGIFYTLTAGQLALIGWNYVFLVYIIGIPVLFFLLFVIPDAPTRVDDNPLIVKQGGKWRLHVPRILFPILFLAFLGSLAVSTTNTNVSYVIRDLGFDAGIAGFAAATFTLGNVVGSGVYSKANAKLGKGSYIIGQVFVAIGLFSCAFATAVPVVFVGVFFIGVGNGIMDPALMMRVGRLGIGNTTLYFALFMAAMNLGSTLQGMLVPSVSLALGGSGYGSLNYGIGGCIILFAIALAVLVHFKMDPEADHVPLGMAKEDAALVKFDDSGAALPEFVQPGRPLKIDSSELFRNLYYTLM